ncbi:hypothetical protein EJ110_NYTH08041 [Nymphaea thermarum]|nr:hypothetical protein EJ110_NYTH08041 [Nymphaea thermarum]
MPFFSEPQWQSSNTILKHTTAIGTPVYIDPPPMRKHKFSFMLDVHAFGVVLLQFFGTWNSEDAVQIFRLHLECCEEDRSRKPNLKSPLSEEGEVILLAPTIILTPEQYFPARHVGTINNLALKFILLVEVVVSTCSLHRSFVKSEFDMIF